MRQVEPFDVGRFLDSCSTKALIDGAYIILKNVDGRLIKSVPSRESNKRDYFIVKLSDTSLIQRYMVIVRDYTNSGRATNIMCYFDKLKKAELHLEGK